MSKALYRLTARSAVELLRRRETTSLELIDAAERRIAEVEPALNALPIQCFERARAQAQLLMKNGAVDARPGYLHGLPIAIKDLTAVAGVRWTEGSRVFADRIASRSDILVKRLEANGAIVIAKSNTPEFGAGGNTVNDVFGATRNPWDTGLTAGGSSGGSAAAVASARHGSRPAVTWRAPFAYRHRSARSWVCGRARGELHMGRAHSLLACWMLTVQSRAMLRMRHCCLTPW
jgi:amidase